MNKIYQHQDRKDREHQILSYYSSVKEKQSKPTKRSKKRIRLSIKSIPNKQKISDSSQKKTKKN